MKPAPFDYVAPRSLAEALAVTAEHGDDAKLLAGGQSLIPVMNFRLTQPAMLIDLNNLTDLQHHSIDSAGALHVGAMTRHSQLEFSDLVAQAAPLLHDVMPYIAHPQIRNRGTLGGSLAHADPAGELPVIAVALNASLKLQNLAGERWVTAVDFFQSLFTTALQPDDILTEVVFPALPPRTGWGFMEMSRRHGDYAQAGVTAVVTLDAAGVCQSARLVYLNVDEKPASASAAAALLIGQTITPELIETAAHHAAQNEIDPVSDVHASAAYKRHLATVLGRRTLETAVARAKG